MSVRARPVGSVYLDLRDKRLSYEKHVNAVHRARATINTSEPAVAPRFRVAAVANDYWRRDTVRTFANHDRMVAEISRPSTSSLPRHRGTTAPWTASREGRRHAARMSFPQSRRPEPPARRIPEAAAEPPPRRATQVVAVMIGYSENPIIEEGEAGDV